MFNKTTRLHRTGREHCALNGNLSPLKGNLWHHLDDCLAVEMLQRLLSFKFYKILTKPVVQQIIKIHGRLRMLSVKPI